MLGVQNPKVVPFPSAVGMTPLQFSAPFNQPMPRNVPMRGMSSSMIGFVDTDSAQPDIVLSSREFYRKQIMDKARIARFNDKNLRLGGTANILPKPIPTGSFVRMLNTSGNQNNFGDGAGGLTGSGGSMRSMAGSRLGIDLVKKRGEQLQVLAEEQERLQALPGQDFPSTAETTFRTDLAQGVPLEQTPLSREQATGFGVEIIFNTLREATAVGEFSGITTDDLRRAYQVLSSKAGLTFSKADLQDYYETTQEAVRVSRAVLSDTERVGIRTRRMIRLQKMAEGEERSLAGLSGRTDIVDERFGMTYAKYSALWRLDLLLRVLIDTINLQPRQRGLVVRGEAKRILKMKPDIPGASITESSAELAEAREERTGRFATEEPDIQDEDFDYGTYLDPRTAPRATRTSQREREALQQEMNIREQIQEADDRVETSAFGEPMTDTQEEDAPPADTPSGEDLPKRIKGETGRKSYVRRFIDEMGYDRPSAPTGEQLAPDIDQPERPFALAQATTRAEQRDALAPAGIDERMGITPVPAPVSVSSRVSDDLDKMTKKQLIDFAEKSGITIRNRGIKKVDEIRSEIREKRTATRPSTIEQFIGRKKPTGRGKGRPQKYSTPEDRTQARREANQILRKKKNAYDKAYQKAIMEGIPAGDGLDKRAMEIFAEFGFAPSQAFPFGRSG